MVKWLWIPSFKTEYLTDLWMLKFQYLCSDFTTSCNLSNVSDIYKSRSCMVADTHQIYCRNVFGGNSAYWLLLNPVWLTLFQVYDNLIVNILVWYCIHVNDSVISLIISNRYCTINAEILGQSKKQKVLIKYIKPYEFKKYCYNLKLMFHL